MSNSTPKVSVIIPVYNAEKYLRECLESAVSQTLTDIEIICVNDHSNDRSLEILREYEKDDARVKVISVEDGPQLQCGGARNRALDVATGEYISWLDADDFILPNALETYYGISKKNDLDSLRMPLTIHYENDELRKKFKSFEYRYYFEEQTPKPVNGAELFLHSLNKGNVLIASATIFFKRELAEKHGIRLMEKYPHEDQLFIPLLLINSERVMILNGAYYVRRIAEGSTMTNPRSPRNIIGYFKVASALFDEAYECRDSNKSQTYLKRADEITRISYEYAKRYLGITGDVFYNWLALKQDVVLYAPEKTSAVHYGTGAFVSTLETNSRPTISVILTNPPLNGTTVDKAIQDAVDTLLAQTFPDFEIIAVAGKKDKKVLKLLQQYAEQETRIRAFVYENNDAKAIQIFALQVAHGHYVFFADPNIFLLDEKKRAFNAKRKANSENTIDYSALKTIVGKNLFKTLISRVLDPQTLHKEPFLLYTRDEILHSSVAMQKDRKQTTESLLTVEDELKHLRRNEPKEYKLFARLLGVKEEA
jgi:glycosyltransferase involved in cell wall biosynthesis